jgi:integrase
MAEKVQWNKSKYGRIFFREHESRRHGKKLDRYFRGEYQHNKKRIALNFGWSSEGWTELKCFQKLSEFKTNAKAGTGPINFKEEKEIQLEEERKKILEESRSMSFSDYFNQHYLPSAIHDKGATTWKNEKRMFNKWIDPEIGHLPFEKIAPFNIEKIKKSLLDAGRAPRTVQYVLAITRQIWNHALVNNHVDQKFPKIKLKKFDNKRTKYLTTEQADLLLENLQKANGQLHDMALLSLHTGARAGELFSLTWGSVNFDDGIVTLKDAKAGTRFCYLTEKARVMLEARHTGQDSTAYVFTNRNGEKFKSVSHAFNRVVDDCGFNEGVTDRRDRITFHTLRHTFASWHVQNGTPLFTLRDLLGHHSISMTERYSHQDPKGLQTAAKTFDAIVANKAEEEQEQEADVISIKQA